MKSLLTVLLILSLSTGVFAQVGSDRLPLSKENSEEPQVSEAAGDSPVSPSTCSPVNTGDSEKASIGNQTGGRSAIGREGGGRSEIGKEKGGRADSMR
jgi:hypothetical protein